LKQDREGSGIADKRKRKNAIQLAARAYADAYTWRLNKAAAMAGIVIPKKCSSAHCHHKKGQFDR
jgi:hypothetical protein